MEKSDFQLVSIGTVTSSEISASEFDPESKESRIIEIETQHGSILKRRYPKAWHQLFLSWIYLTLLVIAWLMAFWMVYSMVSTATVRKQHLKELKDQMKNGKE